MNEKIASRKTHTGSTHYFILIIFVSLFFPSASIYAADLTIDVNAAAFIRTIPETLFGTNLTAWDGSQNGGNSHFNNLLIASGQKNLRWPGGSWGDAYLWSDMEGPNGSNGWIVSYSETLYMLGKTGGTIQPIVNFPGYWFNADHNDAEAIAAAVAWVQDQKNRTPSAQYWEIGNEIGGSWEAGWFEGINGTYYGDLFADFYIAMKAVNSNIKIGAVAEPYDSNQPWYTYEGLWTRDTLTAAYAKGVVPDFLIVHAYPGTGCDGSYNPTLLGAKVDEIEDFTESMNSIIADVLGPEYVGQIKYWLTEWNSGGIDNTYERWRLYVSAMLQLQYVLEMAKNGWEGSNNWGTSYYTTEGDYPMWYTFPNWYVYPFLTNKFGREMVSAESTNSIVRAYASRDDANNLTIFIINNSPNSDLTAELNITGLIAQASGQSWLMQGAGTTPSGGTTPLQDLRDIKINGSVHPDPLTINSLAGVSFTSGNTFDVNLPRSCMLLLNVPIYVPTQAPYDGNAWTIPGTIEAENYDLGGQGIAYHDNSSGNDGNNFRTDDVDIETCLEGGFDVNGIYAGEWLEYTVNVESTAIYQFQARVASADSNGILHLQLDGENLTGQLNFPSTGGDQNFISYDVNGLLLESGSHILRLVFDSNDWNINWLKFTKIGEGSGNILREWWLNIFGSEVNSLTSSSAYPNKPFDKELITNMDVPSNWADNYGTRIRGYINPITDGNYTFWVAGDDRAQLWLSTDIEPRNAVLTAYTPTFTNSHEWDLNPQQQSLPIWLTGGQKYYIEILHKDGSGADNVSAAWQGPEFERQVVDGLYLSPYIPIKKCTVKAGKIIGLDNISFSGDLAAAIEQLISSGTVNIKIYSLADDYLVYEQNIGFNAFTQKKNTYTYKYKPAAGLPGAITLLKFDTGKKTFTLDAKNINLTGLSCPFYVTFDTGGYCGTGVADETIVNRKKSIPIRLLSGYADTLALSKIKTTDNTEPNSDKLSAKGTLTVKDDSVVTQGLTITWGEQTFNIPGDQFLLVKTGRYKCFYQYAGAVASCDFDFTNCKFTINIKNVRIDAHSGIVTFGFVFGNYDKTVEVSL